MGIEVKDIEIEREEVAKIINSNVSKEILNTIEITNSLVEKFSEKKIIYEVSVKVE